MSDEAASTGKIKLHCHACGAKYLVRANKVQGRRFRAKCKRCGGIIVARHDGDAAFTVLPETGSGRGHRSEAHVRLDSNDLDHHGLDHHGHDQHGHDQYGHDQYGHDQHGHDQDHHDHLHGHDPYGSPAGYAQGDAQGGEWYVVVGGLPQGPFSADDVRDGLSDGRFTPRNYVWRPGQSDWQRLRDHPLFASPGGIPPEGTSETHAAGPRGVRREAADPYYAGPSEETRESSINDIDEGPGEMESEATRLHPARWDDLPPADATPHLDPRGPGAGGGAWGRADDEPAFGRRAPGKLEPSVDIFDERNWAKGEGPPDAGLYAQGPATPEPWGVGEHHVGGWQSAPRRRAILPSPSRSMRPSPAAAAAGGQVEFSAPQGAQHPQDNFTRPLAEHERAAVAGGGAPQMSGKLSRRSPMPLPKPPPPPRKTHDSLSWIPDPVPLGPVASVGGGVAMPFLQPKPEPFWTTGKIVAVAAIGGGLAVAATVTLIIVLTRDKGPRQPVAAPRVAMAPRAPASSGAGTVRHAAQPQVPITVKPVGEKPKAAPAASPAVAKGSAKAAPAAKAAPTKPPPVKVVAAAGSARGSAKAADAADDPPAASKKKRSKKAKRDPPRRRVVVRTTPVKKKRRKRKRRRASRAKKDDLDALIDGATAKRAKRKKKRTAAVDPDALLAAGGGGGSRTKKKKKKSAGVDADALLAAGAGSRVRKKKGLSRG
ncbi:MAG: DUF4339 domain-containing protein, partial [Myxococcales bacterium]|nr:DUF4339 domain-containing protein [Myxococcales bacterium]